MQKTPQQTKQQPGSNGERRDRDTFVNSKGNRRGVSLQDYCFKPGQSGNPAGSSKKQRTDPMRLVNRYTREHVAEVINKISELTKDECIELAWSDDAPMLEQTVAKVMLKCRRRGDFTDLDRMLDRCIGRVPQRLEGDGFVPGGGPVTVIMEAVDPKEEPS